MIPVTKTEHAPNLNHALINKMRLLSRVYGMIVSDFTKSARRVWSACMTEQDAPESSNSCVSQLFILPTTQAVLIALECEGDSAS